MDVSIGSRLRQERKLAKLSQEALARRIGVSKNSVCRWEAGQAYPRAESIAAIADVLGVDTRWLITGKHAA